MQHGDSDCSDIPASGEIGIELFSQPDTFGEDECPYGKPRVFVISDIRLLRDGIALDLSRSGRLDVIGAGDAVEGFARIATHRPAVVLLDGGIGGGLATARRLRQMVPGVKIVVFAMAAVEADIIAWAESGMNGYVACEGSSSDVIAAIEGALRGEIFCSARLTKLLFDHVVELSGRRGPGESTDALTPRERAVMDLLERGLPNKEIARELGIGPATVKNHVHRILGKLRARGRGEAVARLRQTKELAHLASGRAASFEPA